MPAGQGDDDAAPPITNGQIVIDWNAITLQEISLGTAANGKVPSAIRRARLAAIVQISVFDAVNSIFGKYHSYALHAAAPPGISPEATALGAAHGALIALFPSDKGSLDSKYQARLATLPLKGRDSGVAYGESVAAQIVALRQGDGSDADMPWTPGSGPGVWVPAPEAFAPLTDPQFAFVKPWILTSPDQFRSGPPPALDSPTWAAYYEEVRSLGAINSTTRTADQTEAANFWFDPTLSTWNQAARVLAIRQQLTLEDTARVFALLNLTLADAQVAVYDSKLAYAFWRPITAIRAGGGNANLVADPTWSPLRVTPAHPDYPGSHATQSSAAAEVLKQLFPATVVTLDLTSDQAPGVVRHFSSFDAMVDEVVGARIWAGIHTRTADTVGVELGKKVGNYVYAGALKPN